MMRLPLSRFFGCALTVACVCAQAQQVSLKARVEVTRNGRPSHDASNVVVWLTPVGRSAAASDSAPQQTEIPKLIQKNKSFVPQVLVIPVGSKVEFPNHDPFFHNVFSLFEGKRFNLGLYEGGSTRFVSFDRPGISYIFCNIHPQMHAVIIALDTPYHAISDARGEIVIAGVPPGRYSMQIFHPAASPDELNALSHEITVAPGDSFIGTLSIAENNLTAHKNMYGHDYDPPDPQSPVYTRP